MTVPSGGVRRLLVRVRRRWQTLIVLRALATAALGAAIGLVLLMAAAIAVGRSPTRLALLGFVAGACGALLVVRALWPVRRSPSDAQVARFIEERDPSLDDRLVSAVDIASRPPAEQPRLTAPLLADADRRAARIELDTVVPARRLRDAGLRAAAALLLFGGLAVLGFGTVRQSVDALSYTLFPTRLALDVTPGHARVPVGASFTVGARLVGTRAPVEVRLERADGDGWVGVDMARANDSRFQVAFESVTDSFRYRVVAGQARSATFEVSVIRPPRVTRIDVAYRYPPTLALPPHTEEDSGDIYAPAGTEVRLVVHTDHDATSGSLELGQGGPLTLKPVGPTVLEASLTIARDDAYRVRVSDRDGLQSSGDTEYFIRMLDDRPPEVRVLKPARDRHVTRLEEVDIQAEAQDDFGVERLDLVYSVRGGNEKVVPLPISRRETTVNRAHTLYLEDLGVAPGDFVSYYVRARDVARGRRSSETRSDMFFLEVKPFEQEFALAQSQAGGDGRGEQSIEELVTAQKEVIVATWKLDRRARAAQGATSAQDIRSVARAEGELKTRVEAASSASRASSLRDPRRRSPQPGALRAGETSAVDDAMTAAALAMGQAAKSLSALRTADAMPAELEALNQLLKALGDVKKRQVTRQASVGAGGSNRSAPDLSSLFDKELQRHQQTNYETPSATQQRDEADTSVLDKIRDLATRQDELLRRQQDLARDRAQMTAEELKRALETLTREQSQLRQRAEDVARQMSQGKDSASQSTPKGEKGQQGQGQQGQQGQPGQQGQQGQSAQQRSSGQPDAPSGQDGQSGGSAPRPLGREAAGRPGERSNRLRDATDEMRGAVSELRRDDPGQATARSTRALETLRELERQLRNDSPDQRRRAVGDLQLEARQLADAQRQVASELGRAGRGETGRDARRRLAGEQGRLAERAAQLGRNLDRSASPSPSAGARRAGDDATSIARALADASRDLERQRVAERMQQAADALRASASAGDSGGAGQQADPRQTDQATRNTQDDVARTLDRLADQLAAASGSRDGEAQRLSGDLSRARDLRDRMAATSAQLEALGASADGGTPPRPGGSKRGGESASKASADAGLDGEVARLREQYQRQLHETGELINRLGTEERKQGRAGSGATFADRGMVLSAPGTEAFKQDFAKWEALRKQATQALERAESSIAQRLRARQGHERLGANVDDRPPAAYADQVDRYFKALATKKAK